MMDCMYKTNRYRYPLLQIVGITLTKMWYSAAFVFTESEKEDNYIWTLEKLKGLMDPESLLEVIVTDRELLHECNCKSFSLSYEYAMSMAYSEECVGQL